MDIISKIDNNYFLNKLFPNGLNDPLFLGQISFDVAGRLSMNIHTKQKPSIEIDKWGTWGESYNVIVIKLNGMCRGTAILKNWKDAGYAHLDIVDNIEIFTISQTGSNWSIELECETFIFQECSTYCDGAE